MKKHASLAAVAALTAGLSIPSVATAATTGDGYQFQISSGGDFAVDRDRQDDATSSMNATVTVHLDGLWEIDGEVVDGDPGDYTVAVGIGGTCDGNTELVDFRIEDEPGVTSFTYSDAPTLPDGYDIIRIYAEGVACQSIWAQSIPSQPTGEITAPDAGSVQLGTVELAATYFDDDFDETQWAVRPASDGCRGPNVAGGGPNVSGDDDYHWDGRDLSVVLDTTDWVPGAYCFVFNTEQSGESEADVRLIREFLVADAQVSVGGQMLQGDKKDLTAKITVGGSLTSLATSTPGTVISDPESLICDWNIVFHDVEGDTLDGGHFVGDTCTQFKTFVPDINGTDGVVNLTVTGTLDGEPGHSVILRLEDRSEPATDDTIRIELSNSDGLIYDTTNEFDDTPNNVGTARTGLDRGNVQIAYY